MPERVRRTVEFFERRKLWYKLTRNTAATSCRDAAARRIRLGNQGIPLYDELRSYFAGCQMGGSRQLILCHCRANAHFDLNAIGRLLGAVGGIVRVPPEGLAQFQAEYGTINPFSEAGRHLQVFDEGLLARHTPPHTMMTNAGDQTWAIEFHAPEAIEALRGETGRVVVGSIAARRFRSSQVPVFGIVAGNGPESGMALWRNLNDAVHAQTATRSGFRGDVSYPAVMVQFEPEMGLAADLPDRQEFVWKAISRAIERLCGCGATHLAIPCHSAQFFSIRILELLAGSGVQFIPLSNVIAAHLLVRPHGEETTIVGAQAVACLGEYSAYRELSSLGLRPLEPEAAAYMEEIALLVKHTDSRSLNVAALNRLRHVLRNLVHTDRVLIALAEVSLLLERHPKLRDRFGGRIIVDPLRMYGQALADLYLRALPGVAVEPEV